MKNKFSFSFLILICFCNIFCIDTTTESTILDQYNLRNINQLVLNAKASGDFNNRRHAYVVLGTSLSKDGNLKSETVKRLNTCLKAKKKNEKSYIIVSGGRPVNGKTQANVMKKWLKQHSVKEEFIITEQESEDTLENAIETLKLADRRGINTLSIITNGSHARRATLIFKKLDKNNKVNEIIIPKDEINTRFTLKEKERIKKSLYDLKKYEKNENY